MQGICTSVFLIWRSERTQGFTSIDKHATEFVRVPESFSLDRKLHPFG